MVLGWVTVEVIFSLSSAFTGVVGGMQYVAWLGFVLLRNSRIKGFSVIYNFLCTFLQHVYSMERDGMVLSKLNFLSSFVPFL